MPLPPAANRAATWGLRCSVLSSASRGLRESVRFARSSGGRAAGAQQESDLGGRSLGHGEWRPNASEPVRVQHLAAFRLA